MLSLFISFQVFSTSMGLTKTVYNPAALKAAQKTSEEALKKKQVRGEMKGKGVQKWNASHLDCRTKSRRQPLIIFHNSFSQEALRLQQDVRKKKQEILEKHIETQKVRPSGAD